MAKATLPTNYKDDILNSSMNGKRRYQEIPNSDGTISLEDKTTYDQTGTNFGASQVNEMNRNINESADSGRIIDSLSSVMTNTQQKYIAGALALKEVNNSLAGIKFHKNGDGSYSYYGADGSLIPFRKSNSVEVTNSVYYRETTENYPVSLNTSLVVPSGTTFGILAITINAYFIGNSEITGNGVKNILSRTARESTSGTFYDNGIEFVLCEFNAGGTINISSTLTNTTYMPGIVAAIVKMD